MDWDWGYFGKRSIIEHISQLVLDYGKYNYLEKRYPHFMNDITGWRVQRPYEDLASTIWPNWWESPEVQLFESIMEYGLQHNWDIPSAIQHLSFTWLLLDRNDPVVG